MSAITEPFGAIPKRLADELEADELTAAEFLVLCWLELRTNYNLDPPAWRGTTREMYEAMNWPWSMRYLQQVIANLHDRGWTNGKPKDRSRAKYTIQLVRGSASRSSRLRSDSEPTANSEPPSQFAVEDASSQSPEASASDPDSDPGASNLEPVRSPQKQKAEGQNPLEPHALEDHDDQEVDDGVAGSAVPHRTGRHTSHPRRHEEEDMQTPELCLGNVEHEWDDEGVCTVCQHLQSMLPLRHDPFPVDRPTDPDEGPTSATTDTEAWATNGARA